jgi:hypothetical protein
MWSYMDTGGSAPIGLLASGADQMPSSPQKAHRTHSDLPWFRPQEGISRKTLCPACLRLLMKMSLAGVHGRRWPCRRAPDH